MEWTEVFCGLKGSNQKLLAELDELRKKAGVEKLYLIYLDELEAVWGARYPETADEADLLGLLRDFLNNHCGTDYASGEKRILVLNSDIDEVAYVARKALDSREPNYRGVLEVLMANDAKGEVLLTADPSFQKGIKNALVHMLPWVKEPEVQFSNDGVSITDKAARKIKEILEMEKIDPAKGGLRFGLTAGGCSGFQYMIKAEREAGDNDEVFERKVSIDGADHVVRVFVNLKSLDFMQGTVIDYGKDPYGHNFSETFIIINPNKKGSCGCGKSESF